MPYRKKTEYVWSIFFQLIAFTLVWIGCKFLSEGYIVLAAIAYHFSMRSYLYIARIESADDRNASKFWPTLQTQLLPVTTLIQEDLHTVKEDSDT